MAGPIANRVAAKLDRRFPNIPNESALRLEKGMFPVSGDQHEPILVAKILEVGKPCSFTPSPSRLRDAQGVFLNNPRIHSARVFSFGDLAGHVEKISVADVRHCKLLHESSDACCLTSVFHLPPHAR
jgi:hypothetical protein